MSLFGKSKEAEPAAAAPSADQEPSAGAAADTPKGAEVEASPPDPDRLSRIEGAIEGLANSVVASQRPAATASLGPEPIRDVTPDEWEAAINEGGDKLRAALAVRENATQERMRREFDAKLAQIQTSGTGAINSLSRKVVLGEHPYYKSDAAFRKDVDGMLAEVESGGNMVTEQVITWVLDKVTGQHHTRLLNQHTEAEIRRQREQDATPPSGPPKRPNGEDRRYPTATELHPRATEALSFLDGGRGRDPDDFAARLPAHRITIVDPATGRKRFERRSYTDFDDMMARQEANVELLNRQQAVMVGDMSPDEWYPPIQG